MDGLEFLNSCSNEELDFLVRLIIDKGSLTEGLSSNEDYIKYALDHHRYVGVLEKEIIDFGSNTFWQDNDYREIVKLVADKSEIAYEEDDSLIELEDKLLAAVFEQSWAQLSEEDRKAVIQATDDRETFCMNASAAAFVGLLRIGSLNSFRLSLLIANTVSKIIFQRSLSFAVHAGITRGLTALAGPVTLVLTALWTTLDVAGPAYRVITPAVLYIASLRRMHGKEALA